jgi:hypothetical protein
MSLKLEGQLSLDGSGWQRGLNQAGAAANHFASDQLGELKGKIAAAFSIGAIEEISRATIEYAGKINDLSDRLGVSTDYLQQMDYLLKQNGSSAEDLAGVFERISAARADALSGKADAISNFQKLGITQQQIASEAPEKILDAIGKQFKTLGNSPQLTAAFREIGGRGAGVLIPSFMEGLEEGRANAVAAGAVISESVIIQLDEIGDHFDQFKTVLISTFAPALLTVFQFIEYLASQIRATMGAIYGFVSNLNIPQLLVAALKGFASGGIAGAVKNVANSDSFNAAFNAAAQNVAAEDADYQKNIAATNARVEEKSRARAIARQAQSINSTSPSGVFQKRTIASDSLTSVGNFLGAGGNAITSIAHKQLKAAETSVVINRELSKVVGNIYDLMKSPPKNQIGFPFH